jgi:hypothetical protein
MNVLLVTAVFALGAGEAQPPGKGGKMGAGLDGNYQIVYAEEGGRRNNSWEQRMATIANNTLSYEGEGGKKLSLHLKLGKGHTIEATAGDGGKGEAWKGVYILGQDYLCLSLAKGGKTKAGGAAVDGGPAAKLTPVQPQVGGDTGSTSSGEFILILRRVRGGKIAPPPPPGK